MKRKETSSRTGPYVLGRLDAAGVPPKAVSELATIPLHPSTLSRFFNGLNDVSDRQLFEIGFSAGLVVGSRRKAA